MRDGPGRRLLKRVALWNFRINVATPRGLRGAPPYRLGGACRRSGACCEAPMLQASWVTWYLPSLRRLFLFWQERVNGFVRVSEDRKSRAFVFRCTHFDSETRLCDSYDSRPGVCRDYPRALLDQPDPEFFRSCGFHPVAANAETWRRALELHPMSPEQRAELHRKLHLEP